MTRLSYVLPLGVLLIGCASQPPHRNAHALNRDPSLLRRADMAVGAAEDAVDNCNQFIDNRID